MNKLLDLAVFLTRSDTAYLYQIKKLCTSSSGPAETLKCLEVKAACCPVSRRVHFAALGEGPQTSLRCSSYRFELPF